MEELLVREEEVTVAENRPGFGSHSEWGIESNLDSNKTSIIHFHYNNLETRSEQAERGNVYLFIVRWWSGEGMVTTEKDLYGGSLNGYCKHSFYDHTATPFTSTYQNKSFRKEVVHTLATRIEISSSEKWWKKNFFPIENWNFTFFQKTVQPLYTNMSPRGFLQNGLVLKAQPDDSIMKWLLKRSLSVTGEGVALRQLVLSFLSMSHWQNLWK